MSAGCYRTKLQPVSGPLDPHHERDPDQPAGVEAPLRLRGGLLPVLVVCGGPHGNGEWYHRGSGPHHGGV